MTQVMMVATARALSLDMGIHNQYDSEEFTSTLDRIVDAGREHGVAPGMHCFLRPGPTHINEALKRGFLYCAFQSDTSFLRAGVKAGFDTLKGWRLGEIGEEVDL